MRYGLFFILIIQSWCSSAQIVSPPLSCGKHFLGFEFDVHFQSERVELNFKDEKHILPFNRSWVTTQGEHWSDYTDGHLIVASSYPDEPYVAISLKNQKNSMASCDVVQKPAPNK